MARNVQMECCGTGHINDFNTSSAEEVLREMMDPADTTRKATYFCIEARRGGDEGNFTRCEALRRVVEDNDLGDIQISAPVQNPHILIIWKPAVRC
jgi:hypothetical protein